MYSCFVFKMYEDKKIVNLNNEYIAEFSDTIYCHVFPFSYTKNTKTIPT